MSDYFLLRVLKTTTNCVTQLCNFILFEQVCDLSKN